MPSLETPRHRHGDNLYPLTFDQTFGDLEVSLDVPWDVLVTNPPFAKSGKRHRRYFIDTLILDAHRLLRPGGRLVFVQSSMADIPRSIRAMEEGGMRVRVVGETSGPFREYYFEDQRFLREMAAIPGAYTISGGVHYERLIVFEAIVGAT